MRVMPYGREALLAEPDDPGSVLALADAARAEPGVLEVVPAARTLLVQAAPETIGRLSARLAELAEQVAGTSPGADRDEVVLDVHYDGADLDSTAAELGLDADALVRRHAAGHYVVAFCGFAPGFAYLSGLADDVPRLATPRTRVPAGSVALAGPWCGVYPTASPGGWRIIGRTDAVLWDPARPQPALLAPGTRVRFREAR
jgi:5-oxoprolinase (ATP-hydrolysing) subunit B